MTKTLFFLQNLKCFKDHIHESWMFSGFVKELSNQTQRILLFSPQNVWIHSSFYQNIAEYNEEGGAIHMVTNSNQTLLQVEKSTFFNCTSYRGGSIFQKPGNFKSCFNCFSVISDYRLTSEEYCITSYSTNTNDHFQEIEYCSVVLSSSKDQPAHVHYIINLYNGCISINSINISQINNFEHLQALVLIDPTNGYSNNDVQLSSFVNNTDNIQLYSILYFQEQVNCYMCNILQTKGYQIFYASGNLRVYDSCILDNECTYLVYLGSSSYSAYFYNCTCQNSTSNSQGSFITYSVPSSSFLHALDLLHTAFCIAEYDSLDDLKPYIPIKKNNNKDVDEIELLHNRKLKRKLF